MRYYSRRFCLDLAALTMFAYVAGSLLLPTTAVAMPLRPPTAVLIMEAETLIIQIRARQSARQRQAMARARRLIRQMRRNTSRLNRKAAVVRRENARLRRYKAQRRRYRYR